MLSSGIHKHYLFKEKSLLGDIMDSDNKDFLYEIKKMYEAFNNGSTHTPAIQGIMKHFQVPFDSSRLVVNGYHETQVVKKLFEVLEGEEFAVIKTKKDENIA